MHNAYIEESGSVYIYMRGARNLKVKIKELSCKLLQEDKLDPAAAAAAATVQLCAQDTIR